MNSLLKVLIGGKQIFFLTWSPKSDVGWRLLLTIDDIIIVDYNQHFIDKCPLYRVIF